MNPRPPACKAGALTAELTSLGRQGAQMLRKAGWDVNCGGRRARQCATYPSAPELLLELLRHLLLAGPAADRGEALADQLGELGDPGGLARRQVLPLPRVPRQVVQLLAADRVVVRRRVGDADGARCRPGCAPASSSPGSRCGRCSTRTRRRPAARRPRRPGAPGRAPATGRAARRAWRHPDELEQGGQDVDQLHRLRHPRRPRAAARAPRSPAARGAPSGRPSRSGTGSGCAGRAPRRGRR